MSTTLEWKTPRLADLEEAKPQSRRERVWRFGKNHFALLLIAYLLITAWARGDYATAAIGATLISFFIIVLRSPIRCRITSQGITQKQGVITMDRKHWSEIESFRLVSSDAPKVGLVIITANKREKPEYMCLLFDESEVSHQQIRAALLQHLPPDKELT